MFDQWLGVEMRHFAALEAVAGERSFARAAARLGYTQSAVSQQIATLERIAGARLVERPGGPKAVSLTEAGDLLLRHAQGIVARLAAARADLAALAEGAAGSLRVGTYQSVGARILPKLMRDFTAAWPRVELRLRESAAYSELLELVERGDLDLAFTSLPVGEGPFAALELLRDPLVLLVQTGSPLAERRELSLRELAALPLIGYRSDSEEAEARLRARGVEPKIVFRSDDNGTIHGLVGVGVGAAVIPSLAVVEDDPDTVSLALGGRIAPRLIGIAWHRDRYRSAAARAFIETARAVCDELDSHRHGSES
ncbi:MAG: LysR family transcriptional regulator [Actinomycetota bacterium]|nr:LysR family transcriptional regulator [Actinomycetota bacterium]